jgi:putative peptidoglycan lipid II flippase
VTIGGSIVTLLFQSGRFGARDTTSVWIVLAGSALGLSAGTQGRLLASAFYALGETTPPLRASLVRVAITALTGWAVALPLRAAFGYAPVWGAFGLTASAGFAAWIEFMLLRRQLAARIGRVPIPVALAFGALSAALAAGIAGYGAASWLEQRGVASWLAACFAIGSFGAVYLAIMTVARVPEARGFLRRR